MSTQSWLPAASSSGFFEQLLFSHFCCCLSHVWCLLRWKLSIIFVYWILNILSCRAWCFSPHSGSSSRKSLIHKLQKKRFPSPENLFRRSLAHLMNMKSSFPSSLPHKRKVFDVFGGRFWLLSDAEYLTVNLSLALQAELQANDSSLRLSSHLRSCLEPFLSTRMSRGLFCWRSIMKLNINGKVVPSSRKAPKMCWREKVGQRVWSLVMESTDEIYWNFLLAASS